MCLLYTLCVCLCTLFAFVCVPLFLCLCVWVRRRLGRTGHLRRDRATVATVGGRAAALAWPLSASAAPLASSTAVCNTLTRDRAAETAARSAWSGGVRVSRSVQHKPPRQLTSAPSDRLPHRCAHTKEIAMRTDHEKGARNDRAAQSETPAAAAGCGSHSVDWLPVTICVVSLWVSTHPDIIIGHQDRQT